MVAPAPVTALWAGQARRRSRPAPRHTAAVLGCGGALPRTAVEVVGGGRGYAPFTAAAQESMGDWALVAWSRMRTVPGSARVRS